MLTFILNSQIAKTLMVLVVLFLTMLGVSIAQPCTTNRQCTDPSKRYCLNGQCGQCISDTDCGDRAICKTHYLGSAGSTCEHVECLSDFHCSGGKVCGDGNVCVQCTTNRNCSGKNKICLRDNENSLNNRCVECTTDAQCGGKFCIRNQCIACTQDSHCQGINKICLAGKLPSDNLCVQCTANQQCQFGQLCDPRTHSCTAGIKQPEPVMDPGKLKKLGPPAN